MSPRAKPSLGPREFINLLYRHRLHVVLWCGLVAVLTISALYVLPRKYASEAKLFLKMGRESVTLDPTATTGTTVQVLESRENQINSTRDMLKSVGVMERVVDMLGPETILKGPPGGKPSGFSLMMSNVMAALSDLSFSPPVRPSERAISKLSQAIDVTLARNSSVISVSCRAKTPQLAQQILQAYLDAYQEQHRVANRTAGSLDFFTAQSTRLKAQLDAASDRLRDAKNESNIVAIASEQQALQAQLSDTETAMLAAAAAVASSDASIFSLRQALTDLPEQLTTAQTSGFANTAADNMRQEFFKLLIATRDLAAKLGEEHPLVQTQRKQVSQLEDILDSQAMERVQTTRGVNIARQTLELDLRREEALAASHRGKNVALKAQFAELQQKIHTLNEHEVRFQELQRQMEIAEANYRIYADRLEQARIGEALEANRISNVNVVQAPSLVETPVSPKPRVILTAGIFAGICGSLGLAFGLEYFNLTYKLPTDQELPLSMSGLEAMQRARKKLSLQPAAVMREA